MYLIGLTGGIAAGKSAVSSRLVELGAVLVDADELSREAVAPGSPGFARVVDTFGEAVLAPDGSLDRAALGAIIFADPDRRAALNGIVHPEVRRLSRERMDAAFAVDPDAIVVYDVPLLVESGALSTYDLIVVVDAPEWVRQERLETLRGMSTDDARRRIHSQSTDAERRAIADVTIDAGGTVEQTLAQVDELWASLPRT
ncbi:dephospho-CoA kinase [Marisediminicola senii]|uniref:dephospho-CoA kinase n=1 Tax=Marisediminicola senii TaxID=2711233 RepID=UPI0013EDEAE1|nr:dephospho-CoA kinase [Marisediminicola senii]